MKCCLHSGSVKGKEVGSKLRVLAHVCAVSALSQSGHIRSREDIEIQASHTLKGM